MKHNIETGYNGFLCWLNTEVNVAAVNLYETIDELLLYIVTAPKYTYYI